MRIKAKKSNSKTKHSGKENHYKDYLPETRYANETGGLFSAKFLKGGLIVFYLFLFSIIVLGVLHFNGYDLFVMGDRSYNMNLGETIDLDAVYDTPDVEWVSTSANVVVKNNVVTALKSGSAYLYAKKDDIQITDMDLNVLTENESMNIINHSMSLNMSQKGRILVNRNFFSTKRKNKGFFHNIIIFFKNLFGISSNDSGTFSNNNTNNNQNNNSKDTTNNNTQDNSSNNNNSNNSTQDNDTNNNNTPSGNGNQSSNSDDDSWEPIIINTDNYDEPGDVEVIYQDNISSSEGLTYSSSNEKIAKVDEEGNVQPVSPGVVEIIVEDENGNKDHSVVTIKDDSLNFDCSEYRINIGDIVKIGYSFQSVNYEDKDINWSTSDEDKVTVSDSGEITGVSVGRVEITAKVGKIEKKIFVEVTEDEDEILPTDVILTVNNVTVYVGESVEVGAEVSPEDANDKTLSWSSDNDLIASVGNGIIVGKSVGTTLINVTTINGIEKSFGVTVLKKEVPVESISLLKNSVTMDIGDVYKLNYNINPSNATNRNVKISYDKNYVSVDQNNNIKALKGGNTKVQVMSDNGKQAELYITINTGDIKITGLKLNVNNLKLVEGSSYALVASVSPSDTTERSVKWTSSNTKVATVDANGNIKAVSAGTTTITVTSNDNSGLKDSCVVTVDKKVVDVTGVSLNKANISMYVGASDKLVATISPSNASDKTIKWQSDNTKVATVDADGNIKAISEGKATISAISSSNSSKVGSCVVTVSYKKAEKIELNNSNVSLIVNGTSQLSANVLPSDAKDKDVVWSSSNGSVATVDSTGKVKAVSSGEAVITVMLKSNNNIKASCNVKVSMPVKSIVLNKSSLDLKIGGTFKLVPTVNPSNATDKTVTWTSNNTSVATVDGNGNVKGISAGTATITVTSKSSSSIKSSATVKVSTPAPNKIDVVFNCNGGTGGGTTTYTAGVQGQKFNKTCKRTGYTLSGWNIKADGSGTSYSIASGVSDDFINNRGPKLTIYAVWVINKLNIRYHQGTGGSWGGSTNTNITYKDGYAYNNGSINVNVVNYGSKINAESGLVNYNNPSSINFKRSGYSAVVGKEWCTKVNGGGTCFGQNDTSLTSNLIASAGGCDLDSNSECNVVLYVNWVQNKVSVTSIKLAASSTDLVYGNTYTIKTTVGPSNATNKSLKFTSSDPSILSVDSNGKIKVIMNINRIVTVNVQSVSDPSVSASFKVYAFVKLKKLATVEPSGGLLTVEAEGSKWSDIHVAQGMCVANYGNNTYILAAMRNNGDDKAFIKVYKRIVSNGDVSFKLVNTIKKTNGYFGHANDMAYNSDTNYVYVTTGDGNRAFKLTDSFSGMPKFSTIYYYINDKAHAGGAMTYDPSTKKYYFVSSNYYNIADTNRKVIRRLVKADGAYEKKNGKVYGKTEFNQGVVAYNGKLLIIRANDDYKESNSTVAKSHNAIDVYNGTTGEYIGTNIVKLGSDKYELESIDYYRSGYFAIYYHEIGNAKGRIKKIKLNLG